MIKLRQGSDVFLPYTSHEISTSRSSNRESGLNQRKLKCCEGVLPFEEKFTCTKSKYCSGKVEFYQRILPTKLLQVHVLF